MSLDTTTVDDLGAAMPVSSAPSNPAPGSLIGRRVGRYRIDELLGGGMSEVYRAYDLENRRHVSLKRLPPDTAIEESARRRFKREAEAIAQLEHPVIARFIEVFETPYDTWIAVELVEGIPLSQVLVDQGPLPPRRAATLVRRIAGGLAAAHAKSIVHRDLKTENIMVGPKDRVSILDFGLAKQLTRDDSGPTLTLEGMMVGTCRAMSPEQALAEDIDHRSDLFSLGVLLYETLTGISPFAAKTPLQTVAMIISQPHVPILEREPRVPPEMAELIEQLLAKDREHRPRHAGDVAAALRKFEASPQGHAIPFSWWKAAGIVLTLLAVVLTGRCAVPGLA